MSANNPTLKELRFEGNTSPEVSIESICLCNEDCVHNESIHIQFSIIAQVKLQDLPKLVLDMHNLDKMGWDSIENKKWELIIREKK